MSSYKDHFENKGFGTKAIHVGQEPEKWNMNQIVPNISLATTYKQEIPGQPKVYQYSRSGNCTRDVLQENLASLENAKFCRVFSSGLASCMAVANYLKTGDHIISSNDIYGGTQCYFRKVSVEKHGLNVDFIDMTNVDMLKNHLKKETRMIWFESPSNPLLTVVDIQNVTKIVKEYNNEIIVVVDNTFMSPYFQKPLDLGVDVVVHSLTKYLNGHSDVIMGAAITNCSKIDEHLHSMQRDLGSIPSPFDCYLVIRGIKTLHLRMKSHNENGLAVAKWLENDSRIKKVLYPALSSHPQHEIHKKQTTGMSGMIACYLKGEINESKKFLSSLKVLTLAGSLGGVESLAGLPTIMTHASLSEDEKKALEITDNLIRLSIGCEDVNDIINDIDQALKIAFTE